MSHTPGPWRDGLDANGQPIRFWRRGEWGGEEDLEGEANLALLDASPDMLSILKMIATGGDEYGTYSGAQCQGMARAVLGMHSKLASL